MIKIDTINRFLAYREVAVIGASEDKKKFGNIVMRFLEKRGYKVFPVNPKTQIIEGVKCVSSVKDLPDNIQAAIFITKPDVTEKVISDIVSQNRIKAIWLQQGAESNDAICMAEMSGIILVHGECIMMFAKSSGFPHNLHRFFKKTLGKYPK